MSSLQDRDGNVYDKFNAPKWLQVCMISVELKLKWHTNEQVQWSRDKNVKSADESSHKAAPLHL